MMRYSDDGESSETLLGGTSTPRTRKRATNAVQVSIATFLALALVFSCFHTSTDGNVLGANFPLVFSKSFRSDECMQDFSVSGRASTIDCLLYQGQRRAAVLEQKQSKTLAQATAEYERRYARAPPAGFDKWFEWNREHGGTIVDDYDQIDANLAPFRKMDPMQLEDAVDRIRERFFPISTVKIRKGNATMPDYPWFSSRPLMDILRPILPLLPDMDFIHNIEDYDKVRGPMLEGYQTKEERGYDDVKASDAWQFYTAPCPRTFVSPNSFRGRSSLNLCASVNNSMLADNRASLTGPTHGIINLVPMFSWAKYSTSRDIVVPHPIYAGEVDRAWKEGPDTLPFSAKNASLYWRGSTTGRSMQPELWRSNHRVRFVHYIANLRAALERLERHGGDFVAANVYPLLHRLEDTMDTRKLLTSLAPSALQVGFSHAAQCREGGVKEGERTGCDDLFDEMPILSRMPMSEERNHQFVADLDGNSMSGRFYRMLESNSAVFKETLFAEWHDDRLVPWYHFIPIEPHTHHHIPAILDYMINDRQGRKAAEQIAANGRRAAEDTLRVDDLRAYWYRLLLEYYALFQREKKSS